MIELNKNLKLFLNANILLRQGFAGLSAEALAKVDIRESFAVGESASGGNADTRKLLFAIISVCFARICIEIFTL